jgi:CheY-like chemotaxis protein
MKNKLTYIIDDDKLTVKLMSILISVKFCEETIFYNAQLAIDTLKENRNTTILPDAILLDLNMPVMDGWQFWMNLFIYHTKKKFQFYNDFIN